MNAKPETAKPEDDVDALAAEHVLGSLPRAERAEIARRLQADPRLADAVARWERGLAPLSLREPGITPPASALVDILTALTAEIGATAANVTAMRRRVVRWRAAAMGLAASLAAVALALPIASPWQPAPMHYALLAAAPSDAADEAAMAGRPIFVAMADGRRAMISLRQVAGRPAPGGRMYVLWLGGAGEPHTRRIGALAQDERARTFAVDAPAPVGSSILLTIEAEPLPAAPRGPVVSAGRLMAAEP